ncbi:MAG: hypothetical protein JSU63_09195, partial [Phycisphaerales bacterium]
CDQRKPNGQVARKESGKKGEKEPRSARADALGTNATSPPHAITAKLDEQDRSQAHPAKHHADESGGLRR